MYESFFHLHEKPFKLTPDPRYFYLSESHREALSALIYGVRERAGLITLTGPVGVGKTMILASFLDQIAEHAEAASFSGAVSEDRTEFLKDLCSVLGIRSDQDSCFGLSQAIKDFAIQKAGEGRSVAVLVDEAQDLGREELGHFHHLSNLETREAKLLQIVLAGTEKLDEKLRDEGLEALWQRVAIRCAIEPIEPEETIAYIFHRLRVAGRVSPGLFTEDALWRIVEFSRGVPRLLNLVCNQAMISAYSSGRCPVDEDAVLEALKEIDGGPAVAEAEGFVGREEIRRLVEAASRQQEQGIALSEAEEDRGGDDREEGRIGAESGGAEGVAGRRGPGREFFPWILPGRRFALALALTIVLAMVGVVMAIGLLRARDGGVERVVVSLSGDPGAGRTADSPGETYSGYQARRGGTERSVEQKAVEFRPGLLPLRWPEDDEVPVGSGGVVDQGGQDFRPGPGPRDGVPAGGKKEAIRGKVPESVNAVNPRQNDLARIALESYGRLDLEILRMLRKKNPQIQDWNRLEQTVQLVLPEVSPPTNGGVDFYTIQVGAFREEAGASRRVYDLEEKGAQNLFLVRGGADQEFTFVCVGVFESGRETLGGLRQMREWGFDDAFPTRIKGKRLEDILQPWGYTAASQP